MQLINVEEPPTRSRLVDVIVVVMVVLGLVSCATMNVAAWNMMQRHQSQIQTTMFYWVPYVVFLASFLTTGIYTVCAAWAVRTLCRNRKPLFPYCSTHDAALHDMYVRV